MMQSAEHIYTPSELNREIKLHLETGFPRVVVEAEHLLGADVESGS